jgi:uracil phosphoribosyltransferase
MGQRLVVVEHPVLADRLTVLRDRRTGHAAFRQALFEASAIPAVEAAWQLPVVELPVETPLEPTTGSRLPRKIAIVPVLRAGLGMVDPFLRLLPDARVGHVGVYRDEKQHTPVDYYERLPPDLAEAHVFVVDPMLATGGSAVHALDWLEGRRRAPADAGLPGGGARRPARRRGAPPRRAGLDGRGRPRAGRERVHQAGVGGRRRSGVRHGLRVTHLYHQIGTFLVASWYADNH